MFALYIYVQSVYEHLVQNIRFIERWRMWRTAFQIREFDGISEFLEDSRTPWPHLSPSLSPAVTPTFVALSMQELHNSKQIAPPFGSLLLDVDMPLGHVFECLKSWYTLSPV